MKLWRWGLAAALLVAGLGPVTASAKPPPPVAGPQALIQFEKGAKAKFPSAVTQRYGFASDTCAEWKAAATAGFPFRLGKAKPVPAQQPLIVAGSTSFAYNVPGGIEQTFCENRASFTPEDRHTYRVIHHQQMLGPCWMEVIDTATGTAPADMVVINLNRACPGLKPKFP